VVYTDNFFAPYPVKLNFILVWMAVVGCHPREAPVEQHLAFLKDGKLERDLSFAVLSKEMTPELIEGFDPYYAKKKRFRGFPLRRVLALGFAGETALGEREFIFRAKDGYAAYFRGALATEEGAYVAFEDADVPGWEPIGPKAANPAPFYLVWSKAEQADLESHPRPWQLSQIEILRFEAAYPHTAPKEGDAQSQHGYTLFREQCFRCHAINREGGRVGPELNVPRNILEYRPEADVRAYIRNPLQYRYGNMPAHPGLTAADMDALIAYLRQMGALKHDKDRLL
jgi:mono/diheme cytochrome c family protein